MVFYLEKGHSLFDSVGDQALLISDDVDAFIAEVDGKPSVVAPAHINLGIAIDLPKPDGTFHQQVVDVIGKRDNGSSVDLNTCEVSGPGHDQLCTVWQDPDFDPEQRAVYYARAFENPSCRFSTRICNASPPDERPSSCSDPNIPQVIQDRAWIRAGWEGGGGGSGSRPPNPAPPSAGAATSCT